MLVISWKGTTGAVAGFNLKTMHTTDDLSDTLTPMVLHQGIKQATMTNMWMNNLMTWTSLGKNTGC